MKSCIYRGLVKHRRSKPVENRFSYRVFMMYIDLDEAPSVLERFWLWSAKKPSLAWFRRSDHFGDPGTGLKESVAGLVKEKTGRNITGPIRLLTNFRYFGYCFNPISIYYCFNDKEQLQDIVLEVTNTPWGQTHCYVLSAEENTSSSGFSYLFEKRMHVSPFMEMNMRYQARLTEPGDSLFVSMDNQHDGKKIFDAQLALEKVSISSGSMAQTLLRDPLVTLRVITLIHWQALKLWLKRVPLVAHPNKT